MQVLNAPTREELNNAHSKGSWLGIGVPSVRNVFWVSKFKTWCWISLLISSIPIHLLFNSVIFETGYKFTEFHLTIATEEILRGGSYFYPGASLFNPSEHITAVIAPGESYQPSLASEKFGSWYGESGDYTDSIHNISKAAKYGNTWTKMNIRQCLDTYLSCTKLKEYRDLILVMDRPSGWIRQDLWQLSEDQIRSWDQFMPADEPNHLFFHSLCGIDADRNNCYNKCVSALGSAMITSNFSTHITEVVERGRTLHNGRYYLNTEIIHVLRRVDPNNRFPEDGRYNFFSDNLLYLTEGTAPTSPSIWNISEFPQDENASNGQSQKRIGLQHDAFNLSMDYCLAERLERLCHIALSPTILLSVTVAIAVKTITALIVTVVLSRHNQQPLVTLGDAIASFIERPDTVTFGCCILDQTDFKKLLRFEGLFVPGSLYWETGRKRRLVVIPRSVWISSYLLFSITISTAAYSCFKFYASSSFLPTDLNPTAPIDGVTLTQAIVIANSPQILLSLFYVAYNNIFTRLQMAKEWSRFAIKYHPLRVTEPQGEQFATYRLQLPYKYSLPLMAVSVLLHWLLSNAIYTTVLSGVSARSLGPAITEPSLPPNTAIAVLSSGQALLALTLVFFVLIFMPIILGLKRLPTDSIIIGSNSLAISAACHASTLACDPKDLKELSALVNKSLIPQSPVPKPPPFRARQIESSEERNNDDFDADGITLRARTLEWEDSEARESDHLRDSGDVEWTASELSPEREDTNKLLKRIAQSKIRWGVVKMPLEWYTQWTGDDPVGHLGFGTEEQFVSAPVHGNYYA